MGVFSNNAITDGGRVLLSYVEMGAIFTPTKIVMGSGTLPAGTTVRTIKDVVAPVKTLTIGKKKRGNDGTVTIGGVYSNQDVTADFYFRELALYARADNQDGSVAAEECLYSYGNAGSTADLMPAYSSGQPVERQIDLVIYVGNDSNVDLTIASGTAMTVEMGEQMVDGLRKEVGQALEGKADKEHTHTKKDITDFPTSLPASDVYDWAKQPNKPVYTAGEVGALRLHGWQAATDFNALTESGIYQCQGVNLNTPYGSDIDTHFHVMVFRNSDQWIRQVAYDVRGQNCYTRAKTNNVWSSWQQIMLDSDVTSLLAGKQDASTAINTGNIGSQTVWKASQATYANSAGYGNVDIYGGSPGTPALRNTALVSADTTPTTNGQIYWTYG